MMGRPKTRPESSVLAVRLPLDVLDALDEVAEEEDRSLRSVVENILREHLGVAR